mmetsp:Transcript_6933/g.7983  ORF Transcript_6933/g.7983 Transcript_6933/m.7983 type:complete len:323 (+) Transcript_6933:173-1141(+)|eukprot:CAMPEP_0184022282 /NCGR_PEP_ID=MMETSP0954-20121128/10511_1 /TAXON_ID=627963 /ORGANISM="Aplanochytrium sp, Strain PBS07" /LENGTH=322 /DNA_ID=CAMNT_0026304623 /DNA_START=118 /DNA_END=1086 /DNA_ORIENTATION=-
MGKKIQLGPTAGMALIRIGKIKQKKIAQMAQNKKQVATMLQENKISQANLAAERIVKDDWTVEALELLELMTQTVKDNAKLIMETKKCPPDLEDAVFAIIYAEPRTGVQEYEKVVKVFTKKYGKEFVDMAREDRIKRVNPTLVHKLSGQRPNAFLVHAYMKEIASMFGLNWDPDEVQKALGERFDTPMALGGASSGVGASGLGGAAYAVTDGRILPPGQVPAGYAPPASAPDFSVENNDGGDDGGDGGDGGDVPVATVVKEEDSVPHHSVRKNEEKPPSPKPPAAAPSPKSPPPAKKQTTAMKPAGDDLSDLQKRFARLRNL